MKIFLIILASIIISGGVLIGGYTGKIPVVAEVLGMNDAKDLGIDASGISTEEIYEDLETKVISNSEKAKGKGVVMEGKKEVKYTLTQEEITSLANNSPFRHFPFTKTQVRINEDGSVEASAILRIENLFNLADSMGYSGDQVREQMEKYNIPIKDIPVYGKATGYVKDNKVTMDISKAQVAGIPLPGFILDKATPQIVEATEGVIESFPTFEAKSMTFENGKMNFEGSIPENQYFE